MLYRLVATIAFIACGTAAFGAPRSALAPLITALDAVASTVDTVEMRTAHQQLQARHHLDDKTFPFSQYRILRLAFEATRDGGWFGARWTITNREPSSKALWNELASGEPLVGECDELSAWMTEFVCAWGVPNAGLYWPTWNHTIVASEPRPGTRILWPTTQVFLSRESDVDPSEFSAKRQKRVYACPKSDAPKIKDLSEKGLHRLIDRFSAHAPAGPLAWELLRLHRMSRAPSSSDGCPARRRELAGKLLAAGLTAAQERSIRFYVENELGAAVGSDIIGWVRRLGG